MTDHEHPEPSDIRASLRFSVGTREVIAYYAWWTAVIIYGILTASPVIAMLASGLLLGFWLGRLHCHSELTIGGSDE